MHHVWKRRAAVELWVRSEQNQRDWACPCAYNQFFSVLTAGQQLYKRNRAEEAVCERRLHLLRDYSVDPSISHGYIPRKLVEGELLVTLRVEVAARHAAGVASSCTRLLRPCFACRAAASLWVLKRTGCKHTGTPSLVGFARFGRHNSTAARLFHTWRTPNCSNFSLLPITRI